MVNLHRTEEILKSPAIWLCIGCQRCNDACQELVRPYDVIEGLRDLAIETGTVEAIIRVRLEKAFNPVYKRYIQEIDTILNQEEPKSI
jgi:heterodisulfide reductase subunit C